MLRTGALLFRALCFAAVSVTFSVAPSAAGAAASAAAGVAPPGAGAGAAAGATAQPIELLVDATDAPRGIFHSRLVIPAAPGPLALAYPKWIQGEHTPSGPITELAGLTVTALGRTLPWLRDPLEMFVFRVEVAAAGRHRGGHPGLRRRARRLDGLPARPGPLFPTPPTPPQRCWRPPTAPPRSRSPSSRETTSASCRSTTTAASATPTSSATPPAPTSCKRSSPRGSLVSQEVDPESP